MLCAMSLRETAQQGQTEGTVSHNVSVLDIAHAVASIDIGYITMQASPMGDYTA